MAAIIALILNLSLPKFYHNSGKKAIKISTIPIWDCQSAPVLLCTLFPIFPAHTILYINTRKAYLVFFYFFVFNGNQKFP